MEEIDDDTFILDGSSVTEKCEEKHQGKDWVDFNFISNGQNMVLRCQGNLFTRTLDMNGYIGHSVYIDGGYVCLDIKFLYGTEYIKEDIILRTPDFFNGIELKENDVKNFYHLVNNIINEFQNTIYGFNI